MPNLDLNGLGAAEFERMAQALVKEVIGNGSVTFGSGKDGAREATFEGKAPYPSSAENWSGNWIFQAKFHDIALLGPDKARQAVMTELEGELEKITQKYKHPCDNYILITNVPLTGVFKSGNRDKIVNEIVPRAKGYVKNVHVWAADEVNTFLVRYPHIRTMFLHLLVAGDLIGKLIKDSEAPSDELGRVVQAYLKATYSRDEKAQLDQAGDVSDHQIRLERVFFDLTAVPSTNRQSAGLRTGAAREAMSEDEDGAGPAYDIVRLLLAEAADRIVVVGGPGEGKSTIGQYLAQLHRATLLGYAESVALDSRYIPAVPRIPFRIILRDFGQWLSEKVNADIHSAIVERYLCDQIEIVTGCSIDPQSLHKVISGNPTLIVFDGLDEVTDPELRQVLLARAADFADRCVSVFGSNLQILATTRPNNYTKTFDPAEYVHLTLSKLTSKQIVDYVKKWCDAKGFDEQKSERINSGIVDCLSDDNIKLLVTTPLQVTILALIISTNGTPPRQREALFDEYLEIIYKRETGKGGRLIESDKGLLIGLHKLLGYILHERSTRPELTGSTLDRASYSRLVQSYLEFQNPYSSPDRRASQLTAITRDAGDRLVLITESADDIFGFELRSIQEFFAACHLIDTSRSTEQRFLRFKEIALRPHWRNVALFFAGRIGRSFEGEFHHILGVCRDVDSSGHEAHVARGSELALELAADRASQQNKREQQALLDHGIKLLDCKLSLSRMLQVCETLKRLPEEDVADHFIPALSLRVDLVRPDRLGNYAIAALAIDSPIAKTILSKMVDDPNSYADVFDIYCEFDLEYPELDLVAIAHALPRLQVVETLVGCENETAFGIVQELIDNGISMDIVEEYIAFSLVHWSVDEGADQVLLEKELAGAWPSDPILVGFKCLRVLSILSGSTYADPSRVAEYTRLGVIQLSDEVEHGHISEHGASESSLAVTFGKWILHLDYGSVTEASLLRFIEFYGRASKYESIRAIGRHQRWPMLSPLKDLVLSHINSGRASELTELMRDILLFAGRKGMVEWRDRWLEVDRFAQAYRHRSRENFHGPQYLEAISKVISDLLPPCFQDYGKTINSQRLVRGPLEIQEVTFDIPLTASVVTRIGTFMKSNPDHAVRFCQQLLKGGRADAVDAIGLIIPTVAANIDSSWAKEALSRLGAPHDSVLYSHRPIGAVSPDDMGIFMRALSNEPDPGVRAGLCRVLRSASIDAGYQANTRRPFPKHRPRFKGLADLHRHLLGSDDASTRKAAYFLCLVRPPVTKKDFALLARAIPDLSESDLFALEMITFQSSRIQHTHSRWLSMLVGLLERPELSLSHAKGLGSVLYELLSNGDPSLAKVEFDLGLPFDSFGIRTSLVAGS